MDVGEGFYHSPGWNKDYPKIQIITVEEILAGKTVNLPPNIQTFKKATRVTGGSEVQTSLLATLPPEVAPPSTEKD